MSSLESVEWEECLLEPRRDADLEREARRTLGFVPPALSLFSSCPWLARNVVHGGFRYGRLIHLDLVLADLIFLAVSQDSSCRYCYAGQRALFRLQGFDEERIRRVEEASFSAEDDPRERLALDFARRFSRSNPAPSAADLSALRDAGYGDGEIKEIACVAATTVTANRVTTLPALPLEQSNLETRWLVRLFRPLVGRWIRSTRGQPACVQVRSRI